jgi:drug/metabolite transporter (DMT)-like permease
MSRRAWAAFIAVSILWGTPYFFIKVAVAEVSPPFVGWSRILIGALVLLPVAWRLGAFKGMRSLLLPLVGFSLLEIAIPFTLIPVGETYISSSLAAILISALPLVIAILALRFAPSERLTPVRMAGMLIGLVGVVTLTGVTLTGGTAQLIGVGCIVGSIICYALAPLIINRHLAHLHPLGPVSFGLALSTLLLTPFAMLTRPAALPSGVTLSALVALGVLCTAVALAAYFYLIAQAGPSRASIITYVNPAVAVLLGVIVLHESMTLLTVAELCVIAAGSWLSTDGRLPPGLGALASRMGAGIRGLQTRGAGQTDAPGDQTSSAG